jgi:hypothetical protein
MSTITTKKFRVSYPAVFKPQVNKLSGKEEYGVTALFEKGEDLSDLIKMCEAAMIKKWGRDKAAWPKNIRSPFRDQSDRAKTVEGKQVMPEGHVAGAIFISLKSKTRPGVVDENVQPILDETAFYSGCYARASVQAYAYEQAGNRGVSFGLRNIQKVADGEPLGGRTRPEDDFAPVEGASPAVGTVKNANELFG